MDEELLRDAYYNKHLYNEKEIYDYLKNNGNKLIY